MRRFFWPRKLPLSYYLDIDLLDLCAGLFILGTTGSGKSSALRILANWILNHPFHPAYAGLVKDICVLWCCCKVDEADAAERVIAATAKRDYLVRLRPAEFAFNFVVYELTREGGSPASLARLLDRLNTQLNNTSGTAGTNEKFWQGLLFDYLYAAIWVAWLAYGTECTIEHIHDIILTSPANEQQAKSPTFRERSACWQALMRADKNVKTAAEDRALFKAGEFFTVKATNLGDDCRGSGIQSVSSVLAPFLISPIYETVCSPSSKFTPDLLLTGMCCILDFPILIYGQSGMLFQSLVTMMLQEAVLRRKNPNSICLIVRDEFQYLCADPMFESQVASVGRSSLLTQISSTQNIPLLQLACGGDARAETFVHSMLANYRNKLLLANICDRTNRLFSEMFGDFKDQFVSISESHSQPDDPLGQMFSANPFQFSTSESLFPKLPAHQFLTLRRGGPQFNYLIDGYWTVGGQTFANGLPFKKITFSQK
ncbi:MAG: hypothetical protein KDB03_22835 [Planctomycetales bacterium]|nr:hypothetical protein [Planctomycetales bacterium]